MAQSRPIRYFRKPLYLLFGANTAFEIAAVEIVWNDVFSQDLFGPFDLPRVCFNVHFGQMGSPLGYSNRQSDLLGSTRCLLRTQGCSSRANWAACWTVWSSTRRPRDRTTGRQWSVHQQALPSECSCKPTSKASLSQVKLFHRHPKYILLLQCRRRTA